MKDIRYHLSVKDCRAIWSAVVGLPNVFDQNTVALRFFGLVDGRPFLGGRRMKLLGTIRRRYVQQKEMFDVGKCRGVERIADIAQPFFRTVVCGKAKAPVEFVAKYDMSVDENWHARLEKASLDTYSECTVLGGIVEHYRERPERYQRRVLVDRTYRTKENRAYCQKWALRCRAGSPAGPSEDGKERRRSEVASDIRSVFIAGSQDEARRILAEIVEKYSKCQAKLAAWMEDSIPEGLTVFAFPAAVRQFLRTNNMEENLNRQIRQRTRLIPAFPNVSSLLRLVSAICAEISDDWETSSYRYMSTIKEL